MSEVCQPRRFQVTSAGTLMYSGDDGDLACEIFLSESAKTTGALVVFEINGAPVIFSYEPPRLDASAMQFAS